MLYAQYAPAYIEQCRENKNKVAKQSKAGKGKRRDCWKWRIYLYSPPLTSCRIFFSFLDFVTRENRKCLKKTRYPSTDKKCNYFSFVAALLTLKANQLIFKIHLFCLRVRKGEHACLPRSYTKVPRCDDGIIVLPGSLTISPG